MRSLYLRFLRRFAFDKYLQYLEKNYGLTRLHFVGQTESESALVLSLAKEVAKRG